MKTPLLQVRNLRTQFGAGRKAVVAVDDVSFDVHEGEVVSLVGESGSGKSITALSLMGLAGDRANTKTEGEILFNGVDLRALSRRDMRKIRGRDIAMIFQEPMSALNPVFTIGDQISETLIVRGMSKRAALDRAVDLLDKVRIPSPRTRAGDYPHQLSGGMRQRAMIAMALACDPKLLIADEPTTALDVTIQAQILDLLRGLREESNMAMILITHDLGVVAGNADRAVVMYCGRSAEQGTVEELFARPRHPYTRALLDCIPRIGAVSDGDMPTIPGAVPPPSDWGIGCRYATRCAYARTECTTAKPPVRDHGNGHRSSCILSDAELAS